MLLHRVNRKRKLYIESIKFMNKDGGSDRSYGNLAKKR